MTAIHSTIVFVQATQTLIYQDTDFTTSPTGQEMTHYMHVHNLHLPPQN